MEELPIACSLSPSDLADRTQAWAGIIGGWGVRRVPVDGGVRISFRAAPGLLASLHQLVALERECCPWMSMEVTAEPEIELQVTGPDDAVNELRRMFGVTG